MAFQKIEGLDRTGDIDDGLQAALAAAGPPGPLAGGPATRVEIDLNRQVLMLWQGGVRTRILPISSGNGEEYCVDGECDIAVTPPGSFHIGRKAEGLEIAPLGRAVVADVLQRRHRHPRLAVGAALPGVARVHPHPHVRRPHPLRPGRTGYGRHPGGPGPGAGGPGRPARAAAEPGVVVDPAAGDRPADHPDAAATTEPPDEPDTTTTSTTVDATTTTEVTTPK